MSGVRIVRAYFPMSIETQKYRIAVVLPRYGKSLGGGAETLVKSLVEEALSRKKVCESVEIWTTCALDHRTWDNELPEGKSVEDGIEVHRFPVDDRDLEVFLQGEFSIRDGIRMSLDQQLNWIANSVNSSGLYQQIAENHHRIDFILFAPYLFATSFWGSQICPEKSVVFPCLHDEGYAYQPIFKAMLGRVAGLIFNTDAERELAQSIYCYNELNARSEVVGMGFRSIEPPSGLKEMPAEISGDYILYSGRKEQGKNLDLLIEYFERLRGSDQRAHGLKLVMIGAGEINFLEKLPENVFDLGFVSEELKTSLFSKALFLCQPSLNESFSIVMMESWLQGCPVVVHGECAVTRDNVIRSSGGLFFTNFQEFAAVSLKLASEPVTRKCLGENGKQYVQRVYDWDAVLGRFADALNKFSIRSGDSINLKEVV